MGGVLQGAGGEGGVLQGRETCSEFTRFKLSGSVWPVTSMKSSMVYLRETSHIGAHEEEIGLGFGKKEGEGRTCR